MFKELFYNQKKRILLIADVRGWAYADAAQSWKKMLDKEFEIDIMYLSEYPSVHSGHGLIRIIKQLQSDALTGVKTCSKELLDVSNQSLYKRDLRQLNPVFDHNRYDGIYFFYHRALCDNRLLSTPFPMEKVCIAINNEKWAEKTAAVEFADYMRGAKIVAGCNSNIINAFSGVGANMMRVSQCVDNKVFFEARESFTSTRSGSKFVVGWSGAKDNSIKNLPMIKEACGKAGVKLLVASNLSRRELNLWYNKLDAVVCASKSEGGPLMLLEAGAVGIPVISTPVGLSREIIVNNKTGLVAEWSSKSISRAIEELNGNRNLRGRLGKALQQEVLRRWTYRARLFEIENVLKTLTS